MDLVRLTLLIEYLIEQRPEEKDNEGDNAEYDDDAQEEGEKNFQEFYLLFLIRHDWYVSVFDIEHSALDVDDLIAELF